MFSGGVIREFKNVGSGSPGRTFPGFPPRATVEETHLTPRSARKLTLEKGDLVWLDTIDATTRVIAIAVDDLGKNALPALGLEAAGRVDPDTFECAEFDAWNLANGATVPCYDGASIVLDDPLAFRAEGSLTLWLVLPTDRESLVHGRAGAGIKVRLKRTTVSSFSLPDPIGDIRDEFTIPRGTARAYELAKGEFAQIIDVEGQQCSDFVAFRALDLSAGAETMIDSTSTRSQVRSMYPQPGLFDKFFDANMRPMIRVVQDTCGRHDALGLACTARGYEERGFPGHLNCSDNISAAAAPFGVARRSAWPAINFFWNTWVNGESNHIMTEESYSRPGDYVAMQALDQLVCVSTACPDDIDPINGWNPTDVHVRIYRPDAPIRRAVAYRTKEDAPMTISRESAFHRRTSALTQHFAPARDLWSPVSFPASGTVGEYWACREAVTLQDMSGLRKYDIVGPDAERLLQMAMTRDVSRLGVWRGTYSLMCDETGSVIDDGTLFRLGPDLFRWCCGTEESARTLEAAASENGLNARLTDMNDALVNLSLQGPKSRDLLSSLVFTQPHVPALGQIKWFGATIARLNDREGAPFMLTRTGYTGELGYEVFCAPSDGEAIWDALIEAGAEHGIEPMGSAALEILRVEAGLPAAGAEFAPGHDALEAGLGFAVDFRKSDFTGKAALARNAESPRRALKGLLFDCMDQPLSGAGVFVGERQIGSVTSATRSPKFECSIALARLAVEYSKPGTELEVGMMDGRMKRLPCRVVDIPFYDPKRERARA